MPILPATAADGLALLVPGFYDFALVDVALADASGVETALQMIARSPSTKIVTFGKQDRFAAADAEDAWGRGARLVAVPDP